MLDVRRARARERERERERRERERERETNQAIGQQHTSPLRAGCEARRREIVLIFGCGNGLVRDGTVVLAAVRREGW